MSNAAAIGPKGDGAYDAYRALEREIAAAADAGRTDEAARAALADLTADIYARARRHLRACFPSFWRPIASDDERLRRKFGTFFRDLNLYHHEGLRSGMMIYDDKLVFDAVIAKVGLRGARSRWLVNERRAVDLTQAGPALSFDEAAEAIVAGPFFAKRRIGGGGEGAMRIGEGVFSFAGGVAEPASSARLRALLAQADTDYLIQDIVAQSPALAAINASSLNTIRCLTYLDRAGRARVVAATLRVGAGGMVVDNASSGGMYCGVDIDRGRLRAEAVNKADERFTRHPASGAAFKDYPSPDLADAFEACARCHEVVGQPMTVGWDVAMSTAGPLLLEGNPRWMAKLHAAVDPGVAARLWSAYLDEWGGLDFGFGGHAAARAGGVRDKRLTVVAVASGRVQKVGFRKWASAQAASRGLAGEVENLRDGSVRLRVEGPARRVEAYLFLVAQGPPRGQVERLCVESCRVSAEDDFRIIS